MTEEIYPMPFFVTLIVTDLQGSADFYQKTLDFKHIFTMPGPGGQPALVHLRWARYADLLLATARDSNEVPGANGVGVSLNFNMLEHFDGNVDAFARHAREKGANVTGPIDQPWNVREVTVLDPDGYRLIFTAPIHVDLRFEEVLERVQKEEK
jgi:uncharacterized glyoxalase superfamily protein PhnB